MGLCLAAALRSESTYLWVSLRIDPDHRVPFEPPVARTSTLARGGVVGERKFASGPFQAIERFPGERSFTEQHGACQMHSTAPRAVRLSPAPLTFFVTFRG
jgi:hypothetical protein